MRYRWYVGVVMLLVVGVLPGWVVSQSGSATFDDVPAGHYAEDAIGWAAAGGITTGVGNNRFGISQTLTREQMVTFLCRAYNPPCATGAARGSDTFDDVPAGHWADASIGWAVAQGITTGVSATRFGMGQTLTREQMVTFLYRAEGSPAVTVGASPFGDVAVGGGVWYERPVAWAYLQGVSGGVASGVFGLGTTLSRGEMVLFLCRAVDPTVCAPSQTPIPTGVEAAPPVAPPVEEDIGIGQTVPGFEDMDGGAATDVLRPERYSSPAVLITELSLHGRIHGANTFAPRPDLPGWDISLPLDWAADPFGDRNWQFRLQSWGPVEYWTHQYDDGNPQALESILGIVLDWERFHVADQNTSGFQWHDHATGIRASRLAFLLDKIFAGDLNVPDHDLERLTGLAELHVRKLREPGFLSSGNHGLFQLAGLNLLCEVISWRSVCDGVASYVIEAFTGLFNRWFTPEGVHRESSPYYHSMVLEALSRLRVAERFQRPEVRALIRKGNKVTPWLTYPDGRWVPVGDSEGIGPSLTGPVQPWCLAGDTDCWAVRDLTESGYAIVRSLPDSDNGSSMLFVSAMGDVSGHKHADDLGFVLIEEGREIFVDSGKYGYNRDEHRRYVTSARAHNVLTLVGRPVGPKEIDGDETMMQPIGTTDGGFVIAGVVDRPRLFRHMREFTYQPGRSLIIRDRVHNRTEHSWQSNLHLAPDLNPTPTGKGFLLRIGKTLVEAVFEGEGCAFDMVMGETDPYQGWVSLGYQKMSPAPVARASCPPDLVESTWKITLHR